MKSAVMHFIFGLLNNHQPHEKVLKGRITIAIGFNL